MKCDRRSRGLYNKSQSVIWIRREVFRVRTGRGWLYEEA